MENYITRIDDNGTTFYQDKETLKVFFQCQYCNTLFESRRRFNQKFCSNSCRTMASRQRNGLGIVSYKDRDKTTNTGLLNAIETLEKNVNDRLSKLEHKNQVEGLTLSKELKDLQKKLSTQTWIGVGNIVINLVNLYKNYQNSNQTESDKLVTKNDMITLIDIIQHESLKNEEVRKYVLENKKIKEIFKNLS